jgi:hypothetical protein
LTEVPSKLPEFFRSKLNIQQTKIEKIEPTSQKIVKTLENTDEVKVTQLNICEYPNCDNPKFSNKHCSVHTNSDVKKSDSEKKDTLLSHFEVKKSEEDTQSDTVLSNNDNMDDGDDDISKITDDIEKALSSLNQAEVE